MRTRTAKNPTETGDPRMKEFKLELSDLLSIGCRIGQEVYLEIRRDWVFVYDTETLNLIGRIRVRDTCLDAQAG